MTETCSSATKLWVSALLIVIVIGALTAFAYTSSNDALKDSVRQEMKYARSLPDASRRCAYSATVPAALPARDYTARVIPQRFGVAVPLESTRILWQR